MFTSTGSAVSGNVFNVKNIVKLYLQILVCCLKDTLIKTAAGVGTFFKCITKIWQHSE